MSSASSRKKKRKDRNRQQQRESLCSTASDREQQEQERGDDDGQLGADLALLLESLSLEQPDESENGKNEQSGGQGLVSGLSVAAQAAGTKRERLERHRVLCSRALFTLLGVGQGAHVLVRPEQGSRWLLATLWSHEQKTPDQVQVSKSLKRALEDLNKISFKTVSLRRLDHVQDAQQCAAVHVRLVGPNRWARDAIAQSATQPHVRKYVCRSLVEQRVLAQGSILGITLNGYPCFCEIVKLQGADKDSEARLGLAHQGMDLDIVFHHTRQNLDTERGVPCSSPSSGFEKARQPPLEQMVAGLGDQVAQVEKVTRTCLIESAARRRVPRGVLLFGPPGTGKTLIARSVAVSQGAKLLVLNGAEVVGRYVGHAEARIHDIFQQALAEQPAIIFIDEIDALCPSRSASGNDQTHARIVGMLLQRMDSLHDPNHEQQHEQVRVAVLAATNRVNAVDQALRRPGRFDREVQVGAPSAEDRAAILALHLGRVPHQLSAESVSSFASDLHGFVGADILALTREASWNALRRCVPLDQKSAQGVSVTLDDLSAARAVTRPSALREMTVQVPHVAWSDVGGQESVKQQLKEAVEWPLQRPEAFARMGICPPRGVLLFGPPGCSKTLLAKAIATQGKMNFIAVKGPELFSKWVGESERAVHEVFAKARMSEPAVVFFDEIDALASARGESGDSGSGGVADRVLSQLLLEMDGIEDRKRVIVVAATNRPDVLDAALLRPGRLDRMAYVQPPEAPAREEILKIHTRGVSLASDVDLAALANNTTAGYSGAEIAALCREAAMAALQEDFALDSVHQRHFASAAAAVKKQITPEMLRFYKDFAAKH